MRFIAVALAFAVVGCAGEPPEPTVRVSNLFSFDSASQRVAEGIAVTRTGEIYLGSMTTGEIIRLSREGGRIAVDLEEGDGSLLGLAFDHETGELYAALSSGIPRTHGVWLITPEERTHQIVANLPLESTPNALDFGPEGDLYVSDSSEGAVWRLDRESGSERWVESELLRGTGELVEGMMVGANGVACGADVVYVANSERGSVVRIPILEDGSAGTPEVLVQDFALLSLDGIALDDGALWGVVNTANRLVRIGLDGTVETVTEGLDSPTSLDFGRGPAGARALYVAGFGTNRGEHLLRVDLPDDDAAEGP